VTLNQRARHVRHTISTRVRWSDVDSLGHANNQAYWRWCEDVRNAQAVAIGLGQPSLDRPSQLVVTVQGVYHAPLSLDDEITVERQVTRLGRASQDANYVIKRGDKTIFEGKSTVVLVDMSKRTSVPYPEHVRQRLNIGSG